MSPYNLIGIPDFEGFSPAHMDHILYNSLSAECPIRLRELTPEDYAQIPILNQIAYIITRISEAGKIKLTSKGSLPVSLVADIYAQGFMKDSLIESGLSKLYKETDSMTIHLSHILLRISGITIKRKGYLSLSKKGKKLVTEPNALLKHLLLTFGQRLNWAYFDGYESQYLGNLGWAFSLFLVVKYGSIERESKFYSDKYFAAFPRLKSIVESGNYHQCYALRTFDRFMHYFGLIEITKGKFYGEAETVKATLLVGKLFEIDMPRTLHSPSLN